MDVSPCSRAHRFLKLARGPAMPVPRRRTSHLKVAQPLQSLRDMPRKQRFKPSRKPKNEQATVSNVQIDDGKEISPREAQDVERQAPAHEEQRDIESDRD